MRTFAILSAASVALAVPTPASDAFKVNVARSLYTRSDGTVNLAAVLANVNRTVVKYGKKPLPYIPSVAASTQRRKRTTGTEPLTDEVEGGNLDELYYGKAVIGSADGKPQTFSIDFDTGSADVFVPGPSCTTADGCSGNARYDQGGKSQSRTTAVTYGSGEIAGDDYSDDVSVAGLKATNQTIISLTDASGFSDSAAAGLFGMGFSTIAETGSPTYFENLISQGVVSTKEFSFFLGRATSNDGNQSELVLGGRDSKKFTGTPTQVAVTTPGYWQVAIDGAKINGASAGPVSAGQAAIDTGTTLVLAPTDSAVFIFERIPGAIPVPMGDVTLFAIPCDFTAAQVPSLTFAGKDFAINPKDFSFGTFEEDFGVEVLGVTGEYCLAGVGAADLSPTENLYIVGDTFLKNWYSIFNYVNNNGKPSVSFAKSVGN